MEELKKQVCNLRIELDQTHTHYQQLLDRHGGAAWRRDTGHMERSNKEETKIEPQERSLKTETPSRPETAPPPEQHPHVGHAVGFAAAARMVASAASTSPTRVNTAQKQLEMQKTVLEAQVESLRRSVKDLETRLGQEKAENDDLRERLLSRQHQSFDQIAKLNEKLTEAAKSSADDLAVMRNQLDEQRSQHEAVVSRLQGQLEHMQHQLQSTMTSTVAESIKSRTEAQEQKAITHMSMRREIESRYKEQMDNIRQQCEAYVATVKEQYRETQDKQQEEICALRGQLRQQQSSSNAEIASLQVQCELLVEAVLRTTECVAPRTHRRTMDGSSMDASSSRSFNLSLPPPEKLPYILHHPRLGKRYVHAVEWQERRSSQGEAGLGAGGGGNSFASLGLSRRASLSGSLPPALRGAQVAVEGGGEVACPNQLTVMHRHSSSPALNHLGTYLSSDCSPGASSLTKDLVQSLRCQWEEEVRQQVEQAGKDGMLERPEQDWPSSSGIGSVAMGVGLLQESLIRYRTELVQERQRVQELMVALKSYQRKSPTKQEGLVFSPRPGSRSPQWSTAHGGLVSPPPPQRPSTAPGITSMRPKPIWTRRRPA